MSKVDQNSGMRYGHKASIKPVPFRPRQRCTSLTLSLAKDTDLLPLLWVMLDQFYVHVVSPLVPTGAGS